LLIPLLPVKFQVIRKKRVPPFTIRIGGLNYRERFSLPGWSFKERGWSLAWGKLVWVLILNFLGLFF